MNDVATRRIVPIVVVGTLLGAAAIAASVATPGIHPVPVPQDTATRPAASGSASSATAGTGPSGQSRAQSTGHVPAWLSATVAALCTAVVLALVAFLIWRLIRFALQTRVSRLSPAEPAGEAMRTRREAVLDAVDAGIADLARVGGDPRAAVIACWVRLEEVAAAAGTRREPGDTPAELVTRLLNAHQVSSGVLNSLAELYRAARYGTHEIEGSMLVSARRAFAQLRGELARSRSGPLEHDERVEVP